MAKGSLPDMDELMEMGIIAAGGAVAGAGAYFFNSYASATNAKTGNPNISFIANNAYITGFALAGLGFVLAQFMGKNEMLEQFGFGMLAGGLAEGLVELLIKYNVKA
jgi:hypothetical protein